MTYFIPQSHKRAAVTVVFFLVDHIMKLCKANGLIIVGG